MRGLYKLVGPIGEDGMGTVWKAFDSRLNRTVAAINHPHICQFYHARPNYLVMEDIEGQPLKGPLPVETPE